MQHSKDESKKIKLDKDRNHYFNYIRNEFEQLGLILDINIQITKDYILGIKFYDLEYKEILTNNIIMLSSNKYSLIEGCFLFLSQKEINIKILNKECRYAKVYILNTNSSSNHENSYLIDTIENHQSPVIT